MPPQTAPPPLPAFHFSWKESDLPLGGTGKGVLIEPRFVWGDLKIQARRADYDGAARTLRFSGDVVVERGDERMQGTDLTVTGFVLRGAPSVDATTPLGFALQEAFFVSPPFSLQAGTLLLNDGTGKAQRVHFAPSTDGNSELVIDAERLTFFPETARLRFENATVRLYGLRLLTVRRFSLTTQTNRNRQQQNLSLPATFRTSRIVGSALGVNLPIRFARIAGTGLVELTSKQGVAHLVTLRQNFLPKESRERDESETPTPTTLAERVRPLITAREPLTYDYQRFGYQDILNTPSVVPIPSAQKVLSVRGEVSLQARRELVRRNADLLFSRTPEVKLSARLPNPRGAGALLFDVGAGNFSERRLNAGGVTVRDDRLAWTLGAELPLPTLTNRVRLRGYVSQTTQNYRRGGQYVVGEARLAADYALTTRSGVGAGLIERHTTGTSPFLWDTVEAPREGHLRGQVAFGSLTLGALGRWDLRTNTLFDTELALAVRGKVLEPRLSYRSQNKQIGFTVAFPGFAAL